MTTEYEKQLEEEIVSLKALLDARTKELDDLKKSLQDGMSGNVPLGGFNIAQMNGANVFNANSLPSALIIDGEKLTANDIGNLHHLWSIHIMEENNPPLLYKIWRRITSCLNTKKN